MAIKVIRSFSGGELSPSLYARTDIAKFQTGLRTLRNVIVLRHGGGSNRSGTVFVSEVKDSTRKTRLIDFIFNDEQTYSIEFGRNYIRFLRNGIQIREASKIISNITQANPAVVTTLNPHAYENGDEVFINNVKGMTQINNRNLKVANKTSTTFELQELDGSTDIDSTDYDAYTSAGISEKVYEISSTYLESELFDIDYVQSVDVITLVHTKHPPAELKRFADDNWTLSNIVFFPKVSEPSNIIILSAPILDKTVNYKVTAIDPETGEESLPGSAGGEGISNITQANPAVVTTTFPVNLESGDEVLIVNVQGMTELNNRVFRIINLTSNTFELDGEDSTNYNARSGGGFVWLRQRRLSIAGDPTVSDPIVLKWTKPSGVIEFNVYKAINGAYGLLGIANGDEFKDIGQSPDLTDGPPGFRNPFRSAGNYPSVVTYIQQRLAFSNTTNKPETIETSGTAKFKNFNRSSPIKADDAITFTLVGSKVNEVRNLLDLKGFIILTSSGEWVAEGDSGIITPTAINNKQHGYSGSSKLTPIIIGSSAVFLQARGTIIRSLGFEFAVDGYQGDDLTIFSSHLFDNFSIVSWAYQQVPHSILWVVRNDGVLLGLTYVKEQQMLAWHRHDFEGGTVESIIVIPEGNEDVLYLIIKRTINGVSRKYIEKLSSRKIKKIEDLKLLDSSLSYDGRNTDTSHTMTLSGGTTWGHTEDLTLTSSDLFFDPSDVGKEMHLESSTAKSRCEIKSFTSPLIVTVRPHATVDASLRNVATSTWSRAVKKLAGLWHLEGKNVSIFADGFVVSSPNNPSYTVVSVLNGEINMTKAYAVIHVGLPITSDIETLNIDTFENAGIDKRHQITQVVMSVEDTRGVWAGSRPPKGNTLEGLTEVKARSDEGYEDPVELKTDIIEVNIEGQWNDNGRVFVRQVDPVPMTILAVAPAGYLILGG